jgi:hypothetical protein
VSETGPGGPDCGSSDQPLSYGQMSKSSTVRRNAAVPSDSQILSEYERGMHAWAAAIDAHKMAPPDRGFAGRLAALAHGAGEAARVCREAGEAGFEWPSARKADSAPPHELRPDTGRRGPEVLWRRFDRAVGQLRMMAAGTDMLDVASAYEELAAIAGELARAVEAEEGASTRARRSSGRARRSA